MVELLGQLMEMIKGMPDLAVWVLAGVLLYKVVLVGSWIGVIRLLINKVYAGFTKERVVKYDINKVMLDKQAYDSFKHLMEEMNPDGLHYVALRHVNEARKALADSRAYKNTDDFKQGKKENPFNVTRNN